MDWRDRNLWAKFSALDRYRALGEYWINQIARFLMAVASVKILLWPTMPVWVAAVAVPPVLGAYIGLGWLLVHYGPVRQGQEVDLLEGISPLSRWTYWWMRDVSKALNVPINGAHGKGLPPEIEAMMASMRRQ